MLTPQVEQVFYVKDSKLGNNWHVVVKTQAQDLYHVPEDENEESISDESCQANESYSVVDILKASDDDFVAWQRDSSNSY